MPAHPASAQGTITVDGVASSGEWDPGWRVAVDGLDVFLTDTGAHPHDAPTFARSGYDAVALWARYQAADDRWYFRLDVDGRPGDSDSATGTAGNLGVGTHGDDGGPLVTAPFVDQDGVGGSEYYRLVLQHEPGGATTTAILGLSAGLLPVGVHPTGGLPGWAAYGTSANPGVIEWQFDRTSLFPAGSEHGSLWASSLLRDVNSRVSEDQVDAVLVVAQEVEVVCAAASMTVGDTATFTVVVTIPPEAALPVSDVVVSVPIPGGTSFVGASDGGVVAGGVITWSLGEMAPGETADLDIALALDEVTSPLVVTAQTSCSEGLRSTGTCSTQVVPAVPTLGPLQLALLMLAMAAAGASLVRRRPA